MVSRAMLKGWPVLASGQAADRSPHVGRPLLSTSRLQTQSSRQAAVAGDVYKLRYITCTSPPWFTTGFSMALAAWYANELDLGNDWTIEGMVLEAQDIKYRLTVNGNQNLVIANGTAVWTDEVPVLFPPSTPYRIGVADYMPVGQFRPANGPVFLPRSIIATPSNRGDVNTSSATVSQVAAMMSNTGEGFAFNPGQAIMDGLPILSTCRAQGRTALAQATAVFMPGDSKEWGDRAIGMPYGLTAAEYGAGGPYARAMNTMPRGRIPFASMGVPGTRFADLTVGPSKVPPSTGVNVNGFAKRRALMEAKNWPYDVILCQMGLNTATNSNSAGCIADARAAWAQLRSMGNKPIIQCLIDPISVSKDEGTNLDNYLNYTSADPAKQVRQANITIDAFNNFVRTATEIDGYIDIAAGLVLPGTVGKWNNIPTQRGRVMADAASGQNTMIINFPVKAGDGLMVGVGDSANLEFRDVRAVTDLGNGTYQVVVRQNFGKPHVASTSTDPNFVDVAGTKTSDGIHYTTQGIQDVIANVWNYDAMLRRPSGVAPTGYTPSTIYGDTVTYQGFPVFDNGVNVITPGA